MYAIRSYYAFQVLTFPIGTLELKTLEIGQMLKKVPMQFDTVSIESEGNIIACGSVVWVDNNFRITSYNVCYTKLLR